MEDGLFQLLFILVIVVASVFDAVARSRKKRDRMEEMEREEQAEEAGAAPPEHPREIPREERAQPEWEPVRSQGPGGKGADEEAERETADTMVPQDLWSILTGQAPSQPDPERTEEREEASAPGPGDHRRGEATRPGPEDPRRQEGAPAPGRRSDPDPPVAPRIPTPVPGDRYRPERDEVREPRLPAPVSRQQRPPTRRSDRWMEGIEGRPSDTGWADEAEIFGSLEEPWEDIPDIAEGEIADDVGGLPEIGAEEARDPRRTRRGRGASPYTRLLESGSPGDLRKAIVLREVLGPPTALRPPGGDGWIER